VGGADVPAKRGAISWVNRSWGKGATKGEGGTFAFKKARKAGRRINGDRGRREGTAAGVDQI